MSHSKCRPEHCLLRMQLLGGRTKPDGDPLVASFQLKDGVVAFEDGDDAERFAQQLEAESSAQVWPFRCQSLLYGSSGVSRGVGSV